MVISCLLGPGREPGRVGSTVARGPGDHHTCRPTGDPQDRPAAGAAARREGGTGGPLLARQPAWDRDDSQAQIEGGLGGAASGCGVIPSWVPTAPGPCPCGQPRTGGTVSCAALVARGCRVARAGFLAGSLSAPGHPARVRSGLRAGAGEGRRGPVTQGSGLLPRPKRARRQGPGHVPGRYPACRLRWSGRVA